MARFQVIHSVTTIKSGVCGPLFCTHKLVCAPYTTWPPKTVPGFDPLPLAKSGVRGRSGKFCPHQLGRKVQPHIIMSIIHFETTKSNRTTRGHILERCAPYIYICQPRPRSASSDGILSPSCIMLLLLLLLRRLDDVAHGVSRGVRGWLHKFLKAAGPMIDYGLIKYHLPRVYDTVILKLVARCKLGANTNINNNTFRPGGLFDILSINTIHRAVT